MYFVFDRVAGGRVLKCLVIEASPTILPMTSARDFTQCNTGLWAANYRMYDCVLRELPALVDAASPGTDV